MKKDGNGEGKKKSTDDIKKVKEQVKDPVSNSPTDKRHAFNQRNTRNSNKGISEDDQKRSNPSALEAGSSPYEMGEGGTGAEDERQAPIIPDDPIEAEQIESEKLRFGFSFEPKEGQLGDETEDEGDLTAEQRKTGNRYKPFLGVDDGERDNETIASDQDLRVTDQGHIGMAFGEDNYVDEGDKQE